MTLRQVLGERTAPRIRSAEGRGNVVMRMGTQQPDLHNSIITHPSVSLKISSSCPFLKSNGDEARSPIIFIRNDKSSLDRAASLLYILIHSAVIAELHLIG